MKELKQAILGATAGVTLVADRSVKAKTLSAMLRRALNSASRLIGIRIGAAVVCVIAASSLCSSADAADVDFPLKAPPVMPDLTWHGITFIGAIDVGAQYVQNGAPYAGFQSTTPALIAPSSRSAQWYFSPNQSLQSYIGVKVVEPLTSDLKFIARAEMGFDPTTGTIADGLKAVQRNNGIPSNLQTFNGDASRAGQIFNGEAWAGFDEKRWGTIHVGRNNSVSLDMIGAYDPLASYGFSLYGFSGLLAGQGSSETGRVDDSIKYLNSVGPFRTEILYGHPNTNAKDFVQGTIGFVQPNFSVDLIGGHASAAVSINALAGPANLGSSFLGARVFDTDMYGIFAKYVFDVGGNGPLNTPESKFTISGGYSRLDFSNPADGGWAPGHSTIGGYQIGPIFATNASIASGIVNYAFTGGDKVVGISFIAGKYQYNPQLSFALGYYRYDQNSFGFGVNSTPGIVAPSYSNAKCSSSAFANCAGSEQVVSFRADYQWTKNVMAYAGMAYSKVSGGFAFGYLKTSNFDPAIGLRFTW
jgi:predicted porin